LRVLVVTLPSISLFWEGEGVGLIQKSEEGEYFSYVGNMTTNDASGTGKSKSRTAVANTAFYKKENTVFKCKLDLILR